MKKRTVKILCVVFMLSLTACGKDQKDTTPSMQTESVSHEEKESKTITETAEDAGQEISEMVELPEKEDEL